MRLDEEEAVLFCRLSQLWNEAEENTASPCSHSDQTHRPSVLSPFVNNVAAICQHLRSNPFQLAFPSFDVPLAAVSPTREDVMNRIFTVAVTRRRSEDGKLRRNGQGFVNGLNGRAASGRSIRQFRPSSQPDIFASVSRQTTSVPCRCSFNCQRERSAYSDRLSKPQRRLFAMCYK